MPAKCQLAYLVFPERKFEKALSDQHQSEGQYETESYHLHQRRQMRLSKSPRILEMAARMISGFQGRQVSLLAFRLAQRRYHEQRMNAPISENKLNIVFLAI